MPLDDDGTIHSDIPVLYSDEEGKEPISWDKNLASLTGTLSIVGRARSRRNNPSFTSS